MVELSAPLIETPNLALQIQQRRHRDKTRPAHPSVYDIAPQTSAALQPEALERSPTIKAKKDTIEVFTTLFAKSESRGSIRWIDFEAAMADLKFSVIPKAGSVFTFFPPQEFAIQRPITLHRPHQSEIEGYKLLIFANRLRRVYGWGEQSFAVA